MHIELPSLSLTVDRPLAIAGGLGARIRVLDGRIWLTEEDCLEDVFLGAGSSYVLKNPGRVVIESDREARIVLDASVSIDAEQAVSARLSDAWRNLTHRIRVARRGVSTPAFAQ
jgi:hypothetical protein